MASLTGSNVVGSPEALQGFLDIGLRSQVIGVAVKDQGEIVVQGLLHYHLRMGGHQHLAAIAVGDGAQQGIDLLLTQDLQVGIGFIDQQHTPFMTLQVGQDQQHLLKAPTSQR